MSGKLFVVATPLGNLDDLSARAIATLRSVDRIACEDTRRTARLLARFAIERPLLSLHEFNERERLRSLVAELEQGTCLALVSDGGTPAISDPGMLLVRAVLERGLPVSPVPGPSAVAALLSASGLPAERYVFEGFLPPRAGARRRRLRELSEETRTIVLFEAPHRILGTLADLERTLGTRTVVLGRELTKLHEEIVRGTAAELVTRLGPEPRGEITLVVAGWDPAVARATSDPGSQALVALWRSALEASGGDRRAALRTVARESGLGRAELYRRLAEHGEAWDDGPRRRER